MKPFYDIQFCVLFFILCLGYVSGERPWLKEGQSCMDGSRNGTCMPAQKCRTRNPQRPIYDYPTCSVRRRVRIICCANEEKPIIDPITRDPLMKTGQKAWDKCLDYLRDVKYTCKSIRRLHHIAGVFANVLENSVNKPKPLNKTIVGGQEARRTQFPHMALLGYGDERKTISWSCGGSLISEKFILTAGHCIADAILGPVKHVALGILKRTDPPKMCQRHLVRRIISHTDYHAPIKYNDIALLETARRVVFGPTVAPACLAIPKPPPRSSTLRQKGISATGWGFLGPNKKLAETLQVVYLKEFNYKECSKLYPAHRHMPQGYNTTTQICYGDKEHPKDTCQGDSGGPLQIPGQASDCQHSIIAVTSYGITCPSAAGMYTRVRPFLPWIENIVWP